MLFFDGNEASRPTREGCNGALFLDDANEEKALRLHKASVLPLPPDSSVFSLALGYYQQV